MSSPNTTGRPTVCQTTGCNKRIDVLPHICKCGKYTCVVHRYPMDHCCTYDTKAEYRKRLEKENPKIVTNKLQRF